MKKKEKRNREGGKSREREGQREWRGNDRNHLSFRERSQLQNQV